MNFWQGERVRLRGIEPSDWEYFAKWNLDSERARHLATDFSSLSHGLGFGTI